MAYIGHSASGNFTTKPSKDTFSGDGSTTAFTLSEGATTNTVDVFVENVRQEPTTAYTVDGTTLTFTAAPGSGTNNIYVINRGPLQLSATHPAAQALEASTGTFTGDLTVDTNTLYVDSTNNRVGVGTDSPDTIAEIRGANPIVTIRDTETSSGSAEATLRLAESHAGDSLGSYWDIKSSGGKLEFIDNWNEGGGTGTRATLDDSGNLLVKKTVAGSTNIGFEAKATGFIAATRDGATPVIFNRKTSFGGIVTIRKDDTTVGSLGVVSTGFYIDSESNHTGIRFAQNQWIPRKNASDSDNAIDLGTGSIRFDDLFATNPNINTSDANEKQQIASLTSAEITAAKAISKLFKTFKWNDKVEAKGDAARTHTGVIAQEVQSAMTDAGLDATKYAFWCSDTWWETQTEVPAVEADEENGIDAKDAYTRTDVFETAEEAPEGATERTRLGIRYPELLAFIGAATEQRLADIETRLTALEAE